MGNGCLLTHACTHARMHTRMHVRIHTHTHTLSLFGVVHVCEERGCVWRTMGGGGGGVKEANVCVECGEGMCSDGKGREECECVCNGQYE